MATGDTLQGRRIVADEISVSDPGDYQLLDDGILWCVLPNGEQARIDDRWKIEEHDDGTISVVAQPPETSYSIRTPGWHGYIERGVWREA